MGRANPIEALPKPHHLYLFDYSFSLGEPNNNGRGERIRTSDLLHPMQAR